MSEGHAYVLDASALLAYLHGEPGSERVERALDPGCEAHMSAANWAEVLSTLTEKGLDPEAEAARLMGQGILHEALSIHALDEAMARDIAILRPLTRHVGLSLGDRACLALARSLGLPVLTAERIWTSLNLGVAVTLIR